MGLASRRRYRWTRGRISDYWDEVFTQEGLEGHVALDDQSAFIASLGASRSARMRDVLGTIAADQDAIIRAGSRGALVVDGGPGKTVVALHRSAYLLYSDPRLRHGRGDVLFIGPHQPYLAYVADVLPSLGEEGVQTAALRDLVAEGAQAKSEADPDVARLKSSVEMVQAIEAAVKFYENPPTEPMTIQTHWSDAWLSADDWAEAFEAPEPGTPHNTHASTSDLGSILDAWLAAHADGIACVIGDPTFSATSRVRSLTPELAKGLEFDLVVLVDPETFGQGIEGAVDRYVAMTRATQRLVILSFQPEHCEAGRG